MSSSSSSSSSPFHLPPLLPLLASAAYFLLPLLAAGSATPALHPLSGAGETALFAAAAVPGSQLAEGYGVGHAGGDG